MPSILVKNRQQEFVKKDLVSYSQKYRGNMKELEKGKYSFKKEWFAGSFFGFPDTKGYLGLENHSEDTEIIINFKRSNVWTILIILDIIITLLFVSSLLFNLNSTSTTAGLLEAWILLMTVVNVYFPGRQRFNEHSMIKGIKNFIMERGGIIS